MLLAGKYLVLAQSPDPENVYTGSPSLAQLAGGRLVASYEWFRPGPILDRIPDQTDVLVSDDDGAKCTTASCSSIRCLAHSANSMLYTIRPATSSGPR